MAYNNVINRADVDSIVPAEVSYELLESISQESAMLQMARRLRNMSVYEEKLPVLSALASAYFPDGETGLMQTSEVNWEDKSCYAEKVAVIVPVAKNTLDDAKVPIWDEIKVEMKNAAIAAIEAAMLLGTNKPSTWPTAIVTAAASASHTVTMGSGDDLYDEILGESGLFAKVEADGFGVTGSYGHLSMKGKLRGVRSADGQPIFNNDPAQAGRYILDGAPIFFPENGVPSTSYPLISGQWRHLVYSWRQDVRFSISDQGVITDADGNIIYNLFQQDMVALKLTMRIGMQLPNPINRVNTDAASRYPFAVLIPAS
jgi:HK97 family phage major capsid protein